MTSAEAETFYEEDEELTEIIARFDNAPHLVTAQPEPEPGQADPRFVVLAGDWHGNLKWALYAVEESYRTLEDAGERRKILIQLGDFGFRLTPENEYLKLLDGALAVRNMELWWIDGNHEDWPAIRTLISDSGTAAQLPYPIPLKLPGFPCIQYLPRGTRWTWQGKTWLAVGGAVSVDKLLRTEGVDWFPDEEITPAQAEAVIAAGPADVLLSHDVPDCWFPGNLGLPAQAWEPMLPLARLHSMKLERIAKEVGVRRVVHGHYHVVRDDWYEPGVRVSGLTLDGYQGNLTVADVERMCPQS